MIALITNYRSGGTFLSYQLERCTDEEIRFIHPNIYDGEYTYLNHNTITILRNPVDALSSVVSMQYSEVWGEDVYWYIDRNIDYYVKCYKYFKDNIDLFIDYDDLLTYPQETFDMICSSFNINKTKNKLLLQEEYESWHLKNLVSWKMVSSKKMSNNYFNVKKVLTDEIDLSECYALYEELMLKVKKPDIFKGELI
jgi:hypothetical protein